MFDDSRSFLNRSFIQSQWDFDFKTYQKSGKDAEILNKLKTWANRAKLSETQAESAFIQTFFVELWNYSQTGTKAKELHSIIPKFKIEGASANGNTGEADLALGYFKGVVDNTPQVLCEFKDIKSNLDARQKRKGANFTPVQQCLNYVKAARKYQIGNEPVQSNWGLVTDMNEFRLYWYDRAPAKYISFTISKANDLFGYDLLSECEDAQFDRFLFQKLFHRDSLISYSGKPQLWRFVEKQWGNEKEIEEVFYKDYKNLRERLFNVLVTYNQDFAGSKTELLRIAQKLLDRFIFVFYCEDMGERMMFPPQYVRNFLKEQSSKSYYDKNENDIWAFFKRMFKAVDKGGAVGNDNFPHINGGLFAEDSQIEALNIPNFIFAADGQGVNDASLGKDKTTFLYLCANYNYAAKGSINESLSLYTLGRIFEQSITELEYKIGELEGKESIAKLNKRKRDGVYYTPEWVVDYIVNETLGAWFQKTRIECNNDVNQYLEKIKAIKILDPACGSGAFLISALRQLLAERKSIAREKEGDKMVLAESNIIAEILSNNIYGVDLNPSSVEIAKLALWLHSARAKAPLSSLSNTILCGNSLIASDIWTIFEKNEERQERLNPFDWQNNFPEIFENNGGFDIILGNPPYVKYQNMMKADSESVKYLSQKHIYQSTQTGNFDIYLPFIEKGISLLNENGRLSFIAPSLWTMNEYGQSLQNLISKGQNLEKWVDFKSHQIFNEAITYTALQFFTKKPNENIRICLAPNGETGAINWEDESLAIAYDDFTANNEWLLANGQERAFIKRLWSDCARLGDENVSSAIFQGIITSNDPIFHMKRIGNNKYQCQPATPKGSKNKPPAYNVEIEDEIMKPLVSGPEAKRFETPITDTYLLFPYQKSKLGKVTLINAKTMEENFPKAWAYLKTYEQDLRGREKGKFDDNSWYRFGRSQSLDKQEVVKLIVAQTVPNMRVCADNEAKFYLNNVRVNGILCKENLGFILGALNSKIVNYVFQRIAKPKEGGYFEANKQFIAPLPIPKANEKAQNKIGEIAFTLQDFWSKRRDLINDCQSRLATIMREKTDLTKLFPTLPKPDDFVTKAPKSLEAKEIKTWSKSQLDEIVEDKLAQIQGKFDLGGKIHSEFNNGELKLFINGENILSQIFLEDNIGKLTCAYWNFLAFSENINDATRFLTKLSAFPKFIGNTAEAQFINKTNELMHISKQILEKEAILELEFEKLYKISKNEKTLLSNDEFALKIVQ